MQNKSRISQCFLLSWLLVSMLLIQSVSFGQTDEDCGIVTCGDQTVYPGHSVQLSASGAATYTWSPATGLSATDIPNPMASPAVTTTYTVSGYPNLVVNGDFEEGNVGFYSDYRFTTGNILAEPQNESGRLYAVDSQLNNHFPNSTYVSGISWVSTGQSGKFMMVNGSGNAGDIVWQDTVSVIPHSNYTFSVRLVHMHKNTNTSSNASYQANLQFVINGVSLGEQLATKSWSEFTSSWNSGDANTALITIYDLIAWSDAGNDFGLDDISLISQDLCTAEVTVNVSYVGQLIRPLPICAGGSLALTPPELFCEGCAGQWEIGPAVDGPFSTFTNSDIPASYNGYYLRYALEYPAGTWSYSNVVPITVVSAPSVSIQVEGDLGCDGAPVVLHADVTADESLDFARVGDVLCTDGSTVHIGSWPVSGKTLKGVVVYVDSTGWNGWALAVDETENVKWNSTNSSVSGLVTTTNPREAIFDLDGYGNTQAIRRAGNADQFPAAYLMDLSQGWCLPSIGQWRCVFAELAIINASLQTVGGTALTVPQNKAYWSSTLYDSTKKWIFSERAAVKGDTGTKSYRVRAMCSF